MFRSIAGASKAKSRAESLEPGTVIVAKPETEVGMITERTEVSTEVTEDSILFRDLGAYLCALCDETDFRRWTSDP